MKYLYDEIKDTRPTKRNKKYKFQYHWKHTKNISKTSLRNVPRSYRGWNRLNRGSFLTNAVTRKPRSGEDLDLGQYNAIFTSKTSFFVLKRLFWKKRFLKLTFFSICLALFIFLKRISENFTETNLSGKWSRDIHRVELIPFWDNSTIGQKIGHNETMKPNKIVLRYLSVRRTRFWYGFHFGRGWTQIVQDVFLIQIIHLSGLIIRISLSKFQNVLFYPVPNRFNPGH